MTDTKDAGLTVYWQKAASAPNVEAYKIFALKGRNGGSECHPICHVNHCSVTTVETICEAIEGAMLAARENADG